MQEWEICFSGGGEAVAGGASKYVINPGGSRAGGRKPERDGRSPKENPDGDDDAADGDDDAADGDDDAADGDDNADDGENFSRRVLQAFESCDVKAKTGKKTQDANRYTAKDHKLHFDAIPQKS